jgi:hypothetical protein
MRVEHELPAPAFEPQMFLHHEQHLALSPGWVEVEQRRSEMRMSSLKTGEMALCARYPGVAWSS